jgi:glycosyltransferase involved in cell wall biosynthesis
MTSTPTSQIRVLQVVLSLDPGGTERLVIELARRLTVRMPMAVCCLDTAGAWAPELQDAGIPVTTLGRDPGFHPGLAGRIAGEIRRHHATVVHCHQYTPFVYTSLSRLHRHGARVVFTDHGRLADSRPTWKRTVANRVLGRLPHRTCAVSGDLRHSMIEEGFPGSVEVIHNGVECGMPPTDEDRRRARSRLDIASEAFVIGTVARLDPVKDLGTLIAAFGTLRTHAPEALLVVVGDGPMRNGLERQAAEVAPGGAIRFVGQRSDVRDLMPAFDVYANSSTSEGVSLTLLEAMAAAVPLVATRVGGTPEVVLDDRSGLLVPARDPGAFSTALATLIQRPDLRGAMGAEGRARLEREFDLETMIARYGEIYEEVSR